MPLTETVYIPYDGELIPALVVRRFTRANGVRMVTLTYRRPKTKRERGPAMRQVRETWTESDIEFYERQFHGA